MSRLRDWLRIGPRKLRAKPRAKPVEIVAPLDFVRPTLPVERERTHAKALRRWARGTARGRRLGPFEGYDG